MSEIVATNLPADGVVPYVLGDGAINFAPIQTFTAGTLAKTRGPAGSAAAVSGTTFTPDVTGYYLLTLTVAGVVVNYTVFAFPTGLLGRPVTSDGKVISRNALAAAVRDPKCTLAQFSAALEGGANNPNGIWTGNQPVQWAAYAA